MPVLPPIVGVLLTQYDMTLSKVRDWNQVVSHDAEVSRVHLHT